MGCGASSKAKSADESVVNTTPAKKEESNTVPAADSIPLPLSLSTEIPTASPKAVFPQESVSPTYPPSLATPEDSASSSQFRKSFQSTLLRLLERNVDMVFLRSLVNAVKFVSASKYNCPKYRIGFSNPIY